MCIILIMIVIKDCIIFLINSSSPSHCRLTVTSSVCMKVKCVFKDYLNFGPFGHMILLKFL